MENMEKRSFTIQAISIIQTIQILGNFYLALVGLLPLSIPCTPTIQSTLLIKDGT